MTGSDAGSMYHAGSRSLQDGFGTRRLAERLEKSLSRTAFTVQDTAFIASQAMIMLATADAEGYRGSQAANPTTRRSSASKVRSAWFGCGWNGCFRIVRAAFTRWVAATAG